MMMLYAFVAVCALSGVLCDKSTENDCSKIKLQENFNISKLVGRWHIAEISANSISRTDRYKYGQTTLIRATVDFQLDEDKSKKLLLTIQDRTNLTLPMVIVDEPTNPANLHLTFNFGNADNTIPIVIVGTDYMTYVIASDCDDTQLDRALILIKSMDERYASEALRVAKEHGLNHKFCTFETCPVITCPK